MSRGFAGITAQNIVVPLVALPAESSNTPFGNQQSPLPPTMVAAPISWFGYSAALLANISVLVQNINAGTGPRQMLDAIRSVRIDNLGNSVPVYVYFPDTGYTVACPPNAIVWEPVKTGQFNAYIIGEGFTPAIADTQPNTTVFFCNFGMVPFVNPEINQFLDLWLASANITRGNSILQQNYGIPALGDQLIGGPTVFSMTGTGTATIFNLGTGFIYITNTTLYGKNMAAAAGNADGTFFFESTGLAGQLYAVHVPLTTTLQFWQELYKMTGNVKLDGSQLWRIRWNINAGTVASGELMFNLSYTTNPN